MPTYYIRYPENSEERAVLSNLIGSLEKMLGITTFDAIGVVLPVGDAASELMRSLARDVIPERATFNALVSAGGVLPDEVRAMEAEAVETFVEAPEASGGGEAAVLIHVTDGECLECGLPFTKARSDSKYCSSNCAQKAYGRKQKAGKVRGTKSAGNGSGFKSGKLVGHADR